MIEKERNLESNKLSLEGFSPLMRKCLENEAINQSLDIVEQHPTVTVLSLDPTSYSANNSSKIAIFSEPKVVLPEIYSKRIRKSFKAIIAISKERAEEIGTPFWVDIQPMPTAQGVWPNNRKNRTCAVFGSKFSANKHSNYSLRRKSLQLDESSFRKVDVFGVDWLDPLSLQLRRRIHCVRKQINDLSELSLKEAFEDLFYIPKNYKGVMSSQMKEMFNYETSLVIENQSDYVSEKLWNSLVSGAVPIYVGPNLPRKELNDLVFRAEGSAESVIDKVNSISIGEIHEKRDAIRQLLMNYDFEAMLRNSASNLMKVTKEVLQS